MSHDYKRIARDGLWDNNIVFSQRLALCPLLAVTGTATNGLGMGMATTVVMVFSALVVAMFRKIISPEVRIPVFHQSGWFDGDGIGNVCEPPLNLSGTITRGDDNDLCAMVLASGKFTFSCDSAGAFSVSGLPQEDNGTVKRQIYADGFFPQVDELEESADEAVVMTRSGSCPDYNMPYDPAVVPGSAGKRIDISGRVLLKNSQTALCAMVLANGQYMFSSDGTGRYALNIPLDTNGQFKLQVYADGFAPAIQAFDEFSVVNDVRMARAVECQ